MAAVVVICATPAAWALPDLTISATVASAYNAGQSGVQIPVTATRTGDLLTSGTFVFARLYFSTNNTLDAGDSVLWEANQTTPDFPNSTLNANGSRTVNATVAVPNVSSGSYYILAVVDPTNFHAESNENNNITAYPVAVGLPDLTISATVGSSYSAGQSGVQIPVTVTRTGGSLTSGTFVLARLYFSTNNTLDGGDTQLWEANQTTPDFPNSTLNANGSRTVTATVVIPNVIAGQYYILAVVDPTGFHSEGNEGNNSTAYAVSVVTLPDLTISATVGGSYSAGQAGVQIPVTVTRTGGSLTSGTFVLARLYFSTNNTLDGGDTQLWEANQTTPDFPNSTLNANGSRTVTATVVIPNVIAGQYYILAVVDPTGFHAESNENNNAVAYPFATTAAGPVLGQPLHEATLTTNAVPFSWSLPPGTTTVEVWIDNASGFGSPEVLRSTAATTTYELPENFLPTGVYNWRVRALASGTWSESPVRRFTYTPAPNETPALVPFYRLYKATAQTRDHFYTTNPVERDQAVTALGYTNEGIECYISNFRFPGALELMRLLHDGQAAHFYTTSDAERDQKILAGYRYEGLAGFVWPAVGEDGTGLVHLLRLRQTAPTAYHSVLIIRQAEYDGIHANPSWNFVDDGSVGRVSADGLQWPIAFSRAMARMGNVDLAVGGYRPYFADQGLSLSGRGPDLAFVHHYNSLFRGEEGPLGPGWSHTLHAYLVEGAPPSRDAVAYMGDGTISAFTFSAGLEAYLGVKGNYDRLTAVGNGGFDLLRKDQSRFEFRPVGGIPSTLGVTPLARIVDRYGNALTFGYVASGPTQGLLDRVTDSVGRQFTFSYTSAGGMWRLQQVLDASLARTLTFSYDASGRLSSFVNARGYATQYVYGGSGGLEQIQRPEGNRVFIAYDGAGRVATVTNDSGPPMSFAYTPSTPSIRQVTVTDPQGRTTAFQHNDGFSATYLRRATENPAEIEYYPDHPALPWRVRNQRGFVTFVTTFTYDAMGNVTSIVNPLGETALFSWDLRNNLRTQTDFFRGSSPTPTSFEYDAANLRLFDVFTPSGEHTHLDYNPFGEVTTITDGRSQPTTFDYDTRGNISLVRDAEGHETTYSRDAAGRMTNVRDAELRNTAYEYDRNDNVERVIDHDQHPVSMVYDRNDNLRTISYVRAGITDVYAYRYDARDRIFEVEDPLGSVQRYSYTDADLLSSRTDGLGRVTTYDYDDRQRLRTIQYPGQQVQLGYDDSDNLTSIAGASGTTLFEYDPLDRLKQYQSPFGLIVKYAYDHPGNLRSLTYPGELIVTYGYDADNRLRTVADWTGGVVTYGYDAASNLESVLHPNGTRTVYGYDLASRLTSIAHKRSNDSVLASLTFGLDGAGNHTSENGMLPLAPVAPAPADITYTIGQDNRLLAETGAISYAYDGNGNRIGKSGPSGTTTYAYDEENRLTSVSGPGVSASHVYDGLGNRIEKVEGSSRTRYLLDLGGDMSEVLAELDGSNSATAYYVRGHGLLARITAAGVRHVYHSDSRGSTLAMTDASQQIAAAYAYDEFGAVVNAQEILAQPFKYVGGLGVMAEAGDLLFMRARFYDSSVARFLERDPLGLNSGEWNTYSYAAANPLKLVDPAGTFGEMPQSWLSSVYTGAVGFMSVREQSLILTEKSMAIQDTLTHGAIAGYGSLAATSFNGCSTKSEERRFFVTDIRAGLGKISFSGRVEWFSWVPGRKGSGRWLASTGSIGPVVLGECGLGLSMDAGLYFAPLGYGETRRRELHSTSGR